jgi:hypothetical protein
MIPQNISSTQARLEDQINWYDSKSAENKRWFVTLKVCTMAAGALVPLLAGLKASAWLLGALGVIIVLLEGLQQLLQLHGNWLSYRSTCESLKHEKFLFLAQAGPYKSVIDPERLLAEHIEELVSREHAKWVATQAHAHKQSIAEQP